MAWFTPDSSGKVLEKLVAAVGPPTEQNSAKGSAPCRTSRLPGSFPHRRTAVVYDGPKRFVAVLGPGGRPAFKKRCRRKTKTLDSP